MSCSCNASALRLFARGLVQVHRLGPGAQLALPVREAKPVQRRTLHASRTLGNAENSTPSNSPANNHPTLTNHREADESTTPKQPVDGRPANDTASHDEGMTEERAKAAWRFKQQKFDWKSFRTKNAGIRPRPNFANFDWKHWKGNKNGTKTLGKLADTLQAAGEEDRAAVGLVSTGRGSYMGNNHKKRRDVPSTADKSQYGSRPTARHDDPANPPPKREEWMIQKEAMKEKFPEGWRPHKRLSPDALAGIRALNAQFPDVYTTKTLADKFAVSPEAIRRILKSKWQASPDEEVDRQERWHRRGVSVWEHKAAHGIKPPKHWRDAGVARDAQYHQNKEEARRGREQRVRREEAQYRTERAAAIATAGRPPRRDALPNRRAPRPYYPKDDGPETKSEKPATAGETSWQHQAKEVRVEETSEDKTTTEPPNEVAPAAEGRRD